MARVLSWSLQKEVPRETFYVPAPPPALLWAEPAPDTPVRLAPLVLLPSPLWPQVTLPGLRAPWNSMILDALTPSQASHCPHTCCLDPLGVPFPRANVSLPFMVTTSYVYG